MSFMANRVEMVLNMSKIGELLVNFMVNLYVKLVERAKKGGFYHISDD
jgi:hypothetical protein